MKIEHIDINGKPIPDISKVVLPVDLSLLIYKVIVSSKNANREGE